MDHLERVRQRKAEVAQAELMKARRHFAHAERAVEGLTHQRSEAARLGEARISAELARIHATNVTMTALAGIHESFANEQARLALMDAEILRATSEREKLRQIMQERQKHFHDARKVAEKLGLLADRLRTEEKSLHIRLSESRSDSVLKDEKSGQWTLLQTDQ